MEQIFEIGIDIPESPLKQEVLTCLSELDAVNTREFPWRNKGHKDFEPHMAIIHTPSKSAGLSEDLNKVRQMYQRTAIVVISPDKSPEHIVEVMKAGADEFLSNTLDPSRLKELVEKFRKNIASFFKAKGNLYSFISAKGGLGSTVISVNTAAALAMKTKESVALLDMSLQSGDSSVYLDTLPQTTLADICKNFHRLDYSFLKTSMLRHPTGLDYLAAPKDPEESGAVQGAQIKKVLELAKNNYDNVVVDCSSMLVDECSLEAFRASDRIFLLTDLSVPAIRNAVRLSQLMQKLKIPAQKVEIAVNRFIKNGPSLHSVENSIQKKIFWLFPNDFDSVIASINEGTPLVKSKPGATFAKNVSEFVQKLKNPDQFASYRGAKGILGKTI